MSSTLRDVGKILLTIIMVFFLYGSVITILPSAIEAHWLLGAGAIAFYCFAIALGIQEIRSKEAEKFPINKGVGIFLLMILVAAGVAAAISLLLELQGWATYRPAVKHSFIEFNNYYLWVFFSMIPGLEITTSLGLAEPLQPQGVITGLPIVGFRSFVLFGLLSSLKMWWQTRQKKPDREPAK